MPKHLKIPKHFKIKKKTNIIALMITFVLLVTIMALENHFTVFYGTDHGYNMNTENTNSPNQTEDLDKLGNKSQQDENNQAKDAEDIEEVNEDKSINTLAQATSVVYLDPDNGEDTNDGLTSDTAVKTFDQAKALSSTGGTICLCNTLTLSTDNVTIDGGDKSLTLKRYGSSFTGAMIDSTATGINIKNLTIDGGAVWTGNVDKTLGRGTANSGIQAQNSIIKVSSGDAIVTNCILQNNDNAGGYGGGVYVGSTATFTMTGGNISSNTAKSYGGGIYSVGTTELHGVTVGGKNAGNNTTDSRSCGGGIYVSGGTITVTEETSISYNNTTYGGGVYVGSTGTFTMTGGNISSNTSNAGGGGIYTKGTTELHGVTIGGQNAGNETTKKDNVMSNSGGGIRVEAGTTTISDSTNISYNSSGIAGGVYVLKNGTFTMTGGSVSSNAAAFGGGGIYSSGTTTLKGVTVGGSNTGNTASRGYGGGIFVSNGTCELMSDDDGNLTNILNNSSESAGGVSVASGSTLKMTGGNISSNTSTKNGGGIYTNGTTELNGVIVGGQDAGNKITSSGYGGGVYVNTSGTFKMTGGNISSNKATSYGGGIYTDGTTELHGVTVGGQDAGNTTTSTGGYGGGICVYSGTTTVTDGTSITYNTCGYGGGVRVEKDGTFIMTGGNISSNTAKSYGGGIYSGGTTELHGVTVGGKNAGNTGPSYGGGISINAGTVTVTDDTKITCNSSENGGGVYVDDNCKFNMSGGNISSNTAATSGGGIYSKGTTILSGVIVGGEGTGNTATGGHGGGVYVDGGTTTVTDGTSISYNINSATSNIYNTGTLNMNGVQVLTNDTSMPCVKLDDGTVNWSNLVKIDGQVEVSANTVNSIVTGELTDGSNINFSVGESAVTSGWTVAKSDGTYAMTEADANKFSVQSDVTHRLVKLNLGTTSAEVKIWLPIRYTITIPESISGANEVMSGDFDVNLSYTTMLSNEKIKMDVIVPQGGIIMKQKIGDSYDSTKYLKVGFGLSKDNIVEYPTSGTYEVLRMTREEYDNDVFNKKVYWKLNKPSENTVVDFGDYEVPGGVTFSFSVVTT